MLPRNYLARIGEPIRCRQPSSFACRCPPKGKGNSLICLHENTKLQAPSSNSQAPNQGLSEVLVIQSDVLNFGAWDLELPSTEAPRVMALKPLEQRIIKRCPWRPSSGKLT